MGWSWRRAAVVIPSATTPNLCGVNLVTSTQTSRAVALSTRGILRLGVGGLGARDRVRHHHAADRGPDPPRLPRRTAGLDRTGLRLIHRDGSSYSLGKARETSWISGGLDSAAFPPKGPLCTAP